MTIANAPLPLASQVKLNSNITVSIPLRGLGTQPGFADGGTAYNSGDPTMTVTVATGPIGAAGSQAWQDLIDSCERLIREGAATQS